MDKTIIEEVLNQPFRIMVIGDTMIDRYVFGDVVRISPEAPIPVLLETRIEDRLGGAANVANNIQSFGSESILVTVTSESPSNNVIEELRKKSNLWAQFFEDPSRKTTIKTRYIAKNQHLLRVDNESTHNIDSKISQEILDWIKDHIELNSAIIIQDYAKGMITQELIDGIHKLNTKNIPILVDPNPRNKINYKDKITLYKPNFTEALKLAHMNFHINPDNVIDSKMEELGERLYDLTKSKFIVITLSAYGLAIFIEGKFSHVVPSKAQTLVDVTGAGDTVIALLAQCLCAGKGIFDSAQIATIGAGIVIEKLGTATVSKDELLNYT